jgi:alcohol dehydrogenase (cytochrome c)
MKVQANLLATAAFAALVLATPMAMGQSFADEAKPGEWATYGRTYANQRYSPLNQITDQNVKKLKLAWALQLGSLRSNEATPIMVGDTLYVSSSWGPKTVFAVNAKTGRIKWQYQPELPDDMIQFACCDVDTRGVAYADGKIFVGRLDSHLVALDAGTGKQLWDTVVVDYKGGAAITSPPIVVRDIVITGYAGGDYGARGALQGYDVNTGKQLWKTWMTAGKDDPNGDTWKGDSAEHGGASTWNVGSYDPKTDTVFWGTSNPAPWNDSVRSTGGGDPGKFTNLYSASTVALDPATGKMKWWYQNTPGDVWDYDGVNEHILADLKGADGSTIPATMKADRDGFLFVINRETGKLVSADPYVPVNWATSYDVAAGKPVIDPTKRITESNPGKNVCPSWIGGKNWQPTSFNPDTGYMYIPANNLCTDAKDIPIQYRRGVFYLGQDFNVFPGPGGYTGDLVAWDPVARKPAWDIKLPLPYNGGTMTTAGNLVFFGDITGMFHALNAKTGENLWQVNLGSGIGAGGMSYEVEGKQYIGIVAGRTVSQPAAMGESGKKIAALTPEGGTLYVFTLGD